MLLPPGFINPPVALNTKMKECNRPEILLKLNFFSLFCLPELAYQMVHHLTEDSRDSFFVPSYVAYLKAGRYLRCLDLLHSYRCIYQRFLLIIFKLVLNRQG